MHRHVDEDATGDAGKRKPEQLERGRVVRGDDRTDLRGAATGAAQREGVAARSEPGARRRPRQERSKQQRAIDAAGAAVKGDQYQAAHRSLWLQTAILLANTQLVILALFTGEQPSAWWLVNVFCITNCVVGLYLVRPHYAEYLRLRALLIEVETDLDVVVTPRRLGVFDASIGGGLIIAVSALYIINDTYMIIKYYFS